ncbi:MAG TPA: hypothetical protein VGC28_05365 [Sphingomonas sp.]
MHETMKRIDRGGVLPASAAFTPAMFEDRVADDCARPAMGVMLVALAASSKNDPII